MAIKRLRFNDDGELEERTIEKSELPPPEPKPVVPKPKARSRAASTGEGRSTVKTTRRAKRVLPAGKTVLDHDMVRFECKKCGASRVGEDATKVPRCALCAVKMTRVSGG